MSPVLRETHDDFHTGPFISINGVVFKGKPNGPEPCEVDIGIYVYIHIYVYIYLYVYRGVSQHQGRLQVDLLLAFPETKRTIIKILN